LYDRSLTELLKRGHGGKKNGGVRNPDYARHILARLSLALLVVRPGESWTRGELDNTLLAIQADDKQVAQRLCSWADASAFLNDVSENSGVLAPQDGPRSPWRFLHRQFRELLAAEALHDRGDEVILSQARELHRQDVPRWAEILGFACELAQEPLNILRALGEVNEELALRVLPELERVDCIKALELLRKDGKWDGDFLTGLLERWIEQSALNRQQAVSWLWNQVTSSRSVHELSYVHYTLEQLAGSVDRESFFQACGRWPSGGPSEPRLDLLPGGTFLMGSRYRVEDWNDDEVPQHAVTLSAFWLNASAMTNEEYERFDPRHHRESFDGQLSHAAAAHHPVVNVSYWEAYLCSRWYGCSLPTEAQWEYACRAGTNTSFSYGDDISPENVNHATIEPSSTVLDRQRTVAVKSLPANAWQLYEMHGNVWEWCSDRFGAYAEEHQSDPKGTFGSSARVLRGGSWNDHAWFARSASREGRSAGYRSNAVGLRLARQPGEAHKQNRRAELGLLGRA
jgi:formylglycine-generating enzyme required for sulfatase activity